MIKFNPRTSITAAFEGYIEAQMKEITREGQEGWDHHNLTA